MSSHVQVKHHSLATNSVKDRIVSSRKAIIHALTVSCWVAAVIMSIGFYITLRLDLPQVGLLAILLVVLLGLGWVLFFIDLHLGKSPGKHAGNKNKIGT